MKIIQTFSQFDEGLPYFNNDESNKNIVYKNFYSFLLSMLTLKKYYGKVDMYCNQKAYDSFIKYIPYNDIIIKENNNSISLWNYYKVDVLKTIDGKFIHVDSDVFIFDDLYREFIETDKYDAIIQDITQPKEAEWAIRDLFTANAKFFKDNNIIDPKDYDNRFVSAGTIGMTEEVKNNFIDISTRIKRAYDKQKLINNGLIMTLISEEVAFYLTLLKYKYKVFEVLPYDLIVEHGQHHAGNIKKYSHYWGSSKTQAYHLNIIKNKLISDFPEYSTLIAQYEKDRKNELNSNSDDFSRFNDFMKPMGKMNMIPDQNFI